LNKDDFFYFAQFPLTWMVRGSRRSAIVSNTLPTVKIELSSPKPRRQ
jgi:hypothetical protein